MMLRRRYQRDTAPPDPESGPVEDAPPADKPAGRSRSSKQQTPEG